MTTDSNPPAFTGTPNDWWDQAERITELQAAERELGAWYIAEETRSSGASTYRISTPTLASNEPRKAALRQQIDWGAKSESSISTKVRLLMRVPIEMPAWMSADFLIADIEIGSEERNLWRKTNAGNWQLVLDGRVRVGEKTMLQLHPAIASITEQI
jgi:hypothetical protein